MKSFKDIQFEVGAWAVENFGNNETPYLGCRQAGNISRTRPRSSSDRPGPAVRAPTVVELGSLAPLMGIAEEVGELLAATKNDEWLDALGDITIYLCDYCCRESIALPEFIALDEGDEHDAADGIVIYMGHLFRCHLKRHQRIRGFNDRDIFTHERHRALIGLIWHLEQYARIGMGRTLLEILNETWGRVVAKRDWRANPETGKVDG